MVVHPNLLLGGPQAHPDEIRLLFPQLLPQGLVFLLGHGAKGWAKASGDLDTGVVRPEILLHFFQSFRSAAVKVVPPPLGNTGGNGLLHIVRPRDPAHGPKSSAVAGGRQGAAIGNGQNSSVLNLHIAGVSESSHGGVHIGHADIVPGELFQVSLRKVQQPGHVNGRNLDTQNGARGQRGLIHLMLKTAC